MQLLTFHKTANEPNLNVFEALLVKRGVHRSSSVIIHTHALLIINIQNFVFTLKLNYL